MPDPRGHLGESLILSFPETRVSSALHHNARRDNRAMSTSDRVVTRAEPCKQCGGPVQQTIRTKASNGRVVKQWVVAAECMGTCVGSV